MEHATNNRKTILLVEDDRVFAFATSHTIKRFGYHVEIAHTGAEAIQVFMSRNDIDLVLMDINLDGEMDGTEAATEILAHRHIPIVFLTAHTEEEYVNRVKEITRYGYVVKNSGDFVLKSSLEMAFELFKQHKKSHESERLLQAALNQSQAGIAIAHAADGKLRYINDAGLHILGSSRQAFVAETETEYPMASWQILHRDRTPYERNELPLARALYLGETCDEEFVVRRDNQEDRHALAHAAPIYDSDQNIIAAIVVFLDITDRKHMEAELNFQSMLLNHIQDLVTATDLDGNISYVNNAVLHMTGKRRDELIGQSIVVYGEDNQKGATQQEILEKTLADGIWRGSVVNFDADGKEHILDCRTRIARNENGKPVALCGVSTDITERKKTEEALKENERILKSIIENSTNVFYRHDVNHKLTYLSPQIKQVLGYEPEEAMRVWTELASDHPLNERGFNLTVKAIQTGQPQPPYELELIHKAGHKIMAEVREAPLVENGETIAIVGALTDITERKQAELALKENQARTKALLNAVPDMMFRIDGNGVYLDFKAEAVQMYTQNTSDVIGRSVADLTYPEFADLTRHYITKTLDSGQLQIYEYQMEIPNQGMREYEVRMVPSGANEVTAIVRDITDRKKAEADLNRALQENQALFKELQHRVKNSFSMLLSMIYLMEEYTQSGPVKQSLREIGARVMALSRMYSLLYTTEKATEVQLHEYLNLVAASLPMLGSHISLHEEYEPITCSVKTAIPVGMIVVELVTNALKYAFPNSQSGQITLSLRKADNGLIVEIRDDGVGMPHGFDLSRANSMGLTIANVLAAQLGATLSIGTKDGTRCVLKVPLRD